jgi:uncharacterized protein YbjT (DUF2867 family)
MNQTNRWDLGRFLQTVAYFEVFPGCSWLRRLLRSQERTKSAGDKNLGVILVAGATGGVGKRVVRKLLDRTCKVRCLVRNIQKAKEMLGNSPELVEGDITVPATLTPALFKDVTAVICCTGTRVQPVAGDTPDRAKYYQGIKFYQPEVVGDPPENVEYRGVQNLVQAAVRYLSPATAKTLFDFANPSEDIRAIWGAVDDVVMGGVSESTIRLVDNTALFTGNVSTANSGGFVSVRTRNLEPAIDLSSYEGVDLRVKGDGKRYKFFLRDETRWDGVGYSYSFDTVPGIWMTVRIPFAEMVPVFRAKSVKDGKALATDKIRSFQLMLSKFEYDGELNPKFAPGSFSLQVESIKAYGSAKLPQFVMVSSAGVTRPGRPGINLADEPPAVRMNDQLGGILTWKLQGEESVRKSGLLYAIIRPCALTEEPGGKALIFEQGDNIRGKVSREDIAELCVQTLEQPQAVNVTFEVKEGENSDRSNFQSLFYSLQSDRF